MLCFKSDLEMRTIEAIKTKKEQQYASATLVYYYSVICQFHKEMCSILSKQ